LGRHSDRAPIGLETCGVTRGWSGRLKLSDQRRPLATDIHHPPSQMPDKPLALSQIEATARGVALHFSGLPTMRPVESNPTATLTMELTAPPRKAEFEGRWCGVRGMVVETDPFVSSHHRPWNSTMTVGVRGTLTKFKSRRVLRNQSTSLDSKSVKISRFPHPHAKFHHRRPCSSSVRRARSTSSCTPWESSSHSRKSSSLESSCRVCRCAGNTGRAHDLETDRRIDEFRAGRDGAALSQRARR
jgi:hypothetical protein